MLAVRKALADVGLDEPVRSHALALARRLVRSRGRAAPEEPALLVAGLEYLAARVERPELGPEPFASRHGTEPWRMLSVLDDLRTWTSYRAYVGEWIRDGCPTFSDEEELDEGGADLPLEILTAAPAPPEDQGIIEGDVRGVLTPVACAPAPPLDVSAPGGAQVPARWRAPFLPYPWQYQAAEAWERNHGRGIMQVVTGAGKTALAVYLFARLLDRLDPEGLEAQLIVVVPRIELARQWARETRRLLRLDGLKLGQYHSETRCNPEWQDILIITQDSARGLLPGMRTDRPVMLVADECHRLGAPSASRILDREYTWTLGLSATPERGGDLGFEQILVPRLGPVVWRYGYQEAVRDGIIAPFAIRRLKVSFTPSESSEYQERSETVRRLLDALKRQYPALRQATGPRFWQLMGDLRRKNPEDARFEMLTAAANERRQLVHFAEQKLEVIRYLARVMGKPLKVLCFHERIEAAERLGELCRQARRQVSVYHSQIEEPLRSENLEWFRRGDTDWLIACRSLDEGLDIPAVDTVVIMAGTKSPRQLIQRLGRALRRKAGDQAATVILVEVAGVDDELLDQEALSELSAAATEISELHWDAGTRDTILGSLRDPPADALATSQAGGSGPGWKAREERPRAGSGFRPRVRERPRGNAWPSSGEPGVIARLRNLGASLRERILGDSWTGTAGNKSYYDKDSSPD